ncbi:unnamed protein product, partial [Mesorhabditis belari]|uniref:PID domain-containing protein n=1 Tax=Mesorhabditis belari TaxID=2138241 RepID=A0AAF3J7T7_9BILA
MAQKMKESPVDGEQPSTDNTKSNQPGSPKSRLAMLKRSSAKKASTNQDPFRFQGQGVQFKGKLIGIRDVEGARGDAMCAEAMRQAKAAVKAAGSHKQRIMLFINIDGIKIVDEKSQATLYNFPVSRISFIARDTTDARAFGFVYGESAGNYKFYGIKTAQTADHAVLSIRDMFQIVFEMKKKQIEQVKKNAEGTDGGASQEGVRSEDGVLVADLLDLETEVHNIEQGLSQLANIPVVAGDEWPGEHPPNSAFADPFGAPQFGGVHAANNTPHTPQSVNNTRADPFGDSFNSSTQTQHFSMGSSMPMPIHQQPSVFHTPYISPVQPHLFQQPIIQQHWTGQQAQAPQHPSNAGFSMNRTAPLPSMAGNFQVPAPTMHWTNENTAPNGTQIHHANTFANFESVNNTDASRKLSTEWDAPRKVTSLEDAFTKLVDMNSLVGRPNEAKKNPFDHIINPPKVPLNALGVAPPLPSRPVVAAGAFPASSADPFSDAFFR